MVTDRKGSINPLFSLMLSAMAADLLFVDGKSNVLIIVNISTVYSEHTTLYSEHCADYSEQFTHFSECDHPLSPWYVWPETIGDLFGSIQEL